MTSSKVSKDISKMPGSSSLQQQQQQQQYDDFNSGEFSVCSTLSTATTASTRDERVASIKRNLQMKRGSLTPMEFSFVQKLLIQTEADILKEQATKGESKTNNNDDRDDDALVLCDEKLTILEENLANTQIFFDPKTAAATAAAAAAMEMSKPENNNNVETHERRQQPHQQKLDEKKDDDVDTVISTISGITSGSARRSEKLQRRRSSSASLLKQATLNIIAMNRLSEVTSASVFSAGAMSSGIMDSHRSSTTLTSMIHAIKEVAAEEGLDDEEDEDENESEDDHDKVQEETNITQVKPKREHRSSMDRTKVFQRQQQQQQQLPPLRLPTRHKSEPVHSTPYRELLTRRASQNVYAGEGFEVGEESIFQMYAKQYDPWEDIKATNDNGDDDDAYELNIIGTSADDVEAHPHVLTPPQMQALQPYLPYSKRGESFWLKYSLVRDGACKKSFLQHLRSEQYTLLAMETLDGEIFGAFTGAEWTIQHNYFGTAESFVWRMKHPRIDDNDNSSSLAEDHEESSSLSYLSYNERSKREREIDVYKYTFANNVIQICSQDRIAVGGGMSSTPKMVADGTIVEPNQFGFAISFDGETSSSTMLEASTSPCVTFNSPALSKLHPDGSKFELLNLEVWAFTPFLSVAEAQQMAMHKLFLKRNTISSF